MTSSGQAGTNTGYIIFLSVASAIGGILFWYDTAVISGTIGSVTQQFSLDTIVTTSFHSFPVAHVRSDFAVLQNLSHNRLHVHDDIAEANVAIKTRFSVLIFLNIMAQI